MLERLRSLVSGPPESPAGTVADEVILAVSALLVEVATVDGAMDDGERDRIILLLRERFSLPPIAAEAWADRAVTLHDRSNQLFPLTKTIADHFDAEQRIDAIEMLWEVAYANGQLHDYEANLMRRITGLLYVSDQDSGNARRRAMVRLGISDRP
jgi:uncharacterized tellurite resistance protein B-like protein